MFLETECCPFLYLHGCDTCFLEKFGKRYTDMYLPFDYSWSCAIDTVSKSVERPVDEQEQEELLERSQASLRWRGTRCCGTRALIVSGSSALEHPIGQRYCLGGGLFNPEVPCALDAAARCAGEPREHWGCFCAETCHGSLDCIRGTHR